MGLLTNWRQYSTTDPVGTECPDLHSLQTRTSYQYLPVDGYPRNTITVETEDTRFSTTRFQVFDEDNTEIPDQDGWFTIPANHTVRIEKHVDSPAIELFTDPALLDSTTVTDYQVHKLDKQLVWQVNQSLVVETQFNPENTPAADFSTKQQRFDLDVREFAVTR